ncbi:hypothetical protein BGX38DRAFT_1268995 [Terfezia claveryi]|nr:hypothetical protein BGX38DRAFT_1268995 [Terfezia claveryi]
MHFYSDEDEGTPCPVRHYSPNSNLLSRQRRDRTTLGRLTAFPLISGDDDDETVGIELTTVLPSISSFANRRKTILNEPPRRPGQALRQKEELRLSQKEKGLKREEEGEEIEDIFKFPSPPLPVQQQQQPIPSSQHQQQRVSAPEKEEEEEEEEQEEEEEEGGGEGEEEEEEYYDGQEYAAALQPQQAHLQQARRITTGATLSQQPRRPAAVPTTTGAAGAKTGRRLSAWIEARVQEKRRQRIAAQQQQQTQHHHQNQPENELAQRQATTLPQQLCNRISAPENVNGHHSSEEAKLVKSYLNAPPKRGTARPAERTQQGAVKAAGAGRGKENILPPKRDSRGQDGKSIHITIPPNNQFGKAAGNKRLASMENDANNNSKKSKTFSTVPEFKAPTYSVQHRPQSYSSTYSGINGDDDYNYDQDEPSNTRKRASSPQPRFVSESDIDDNSFSSIHNPLIRASTTSNRPLPPRNGKLRLIKRRKVSDDATSGDEIPLNPAQTALAKQLAPHQKINGVHRDGPIRPAVAAGLASMDAMNPVLSDDLAQVRMYEDSWLSMLEASVTQLVNAVFEQYEASRASTIETHIQLRREMITLYSTIPAIYKRIQASLAFGVLAVPKESIMKSSAVKSWGEDLGVKKKFMDLFMQTYDVEILGIALEVIIGRELFGKTGPRLSDAQIIEEGAYILSMQEKDKMKLVEQFLEKFLVNCEDAYLNPPRSRNSASRIIGALGIVRTKGAGRGRLGEDDWGSVGWGLRKTVLRALMLILLLDKTKKGRKNLLGSRCLFRQNSQYKSSISILHALAQLLLPSLGDIVRPLSLMGYTVEHIQQPLEEFSYTVDNLAVDMRDGVRLVRLVELLLYPTEAQGATRTGAWPLSKDLKFPAISRVHKLNNVTLALEALEDAGGNENGVKLEDIVDGYRERTVGLLWGIVGTWGLEMGVGGLVDWSELRKEIGRLKRERRKAQKGNWGAGALLSDEDEERDEERGYVALLKCWARCIAEKKGLRVENMTTSFADGRVFGAIVGAYEGYFVRKKSVSAQGGSKLEERLKELGCSAYFASLFGDKKSRGKVFDRDFVIGGLAFLCSRLLQWSVKERAATNIQRAFRAWKFAQVAHVRIHLLILAHECAAFVRSKEQVVNAAIVIQRAFRDHLRVKLHRLINAVIGIQCSIRGYLIRRELQGLRGAAMKIQRWWREVRERRFRQRAGVLLGNLAELQACARGFLERRRVDDVYFAVGIVDAEYGRILKGRRVREEFLMQREAAVRIQRWWRDILVIWNDRENFLDIRSGVIEVQAGIRGALMRQEVDRKWTAVVAIQRWFRAWIEIAKVRHEFKATHWAALVVQTRRRETLAARRARREYLLLRTYTIAVQQEFRERRAIRDVAVVLQRAWRRYGSVVRMRRMRSDVVLVQSLWRGYVTRRDAIPRLRVLRRKLVRAIEKREEGEETLGERVGKGIGLVKGAVGFGRGLLQLEYTTKYSRECAVMLAADEDAIKALASHVESATKQLQKQTSAAPNRNLHLIFNIFLNISSTSEAGHILAQRHGKDKEVFLVLFNFAAAGSKQPNAFGELYMCALEALTKFCKGSEEVRERLKRNWKWLEMLGGLVRGEREKGKAKGKKGKGSGGGEERKVLLPVLTGLRRGQRRLRRYWSC